MQFVAYLSALLGGGKLIAQWHMVTEHVTEACVRAELIPLDVTCNAAETLSSSLPRFRHEECHLLPALADEAAQLGRGVGRHRGPLPVKRHAHDDLRSRQLDTPQRAHA